jgi:hypothetical protein
VVVGIIFTHEKIRKEWKTALITGMVTIPPIFFQFIPYLLLEKNPVLESFSLGLGDLTATIMLVGLAPVLIWAALTLLRMVRGQFFYQKELRYPLTLFAVGVIGYVAGLILPSFVFGPKLLVLASLGAVLGAAHETGKLFTLYNWKMGALVILVLSMGIVLTSPNLIHLAYGSKATLEEAEFAVALRGKIPEGTRVLFLSPGQGKMGEYSHTIPPDIFGSHFVNSFIWRTTKVESVIALRERAENFWKMLADKCVSCVADYDEPFIVVNTRAFPALDGYPIVYQDNGFIVYKNTA